MVDDPLLTPDQARAFVQAFLSHFGAFAIGGAIGAGVLASQVSDRFCSLGFMASPGTRSNCEYIGTLSTRMQLGLAAIAVVVLLTSELISRRRHAGDG